MATYRNIHSSFWSDSKVVEDFTPEDKLFYLYLMTNPHTSICGCYELSMRQMMFETGFSIDTCKKLIERFEKVHNVIRYDASTKEVLLLNWHKYNWNGSETTRKAISTAIQYVKNDAFRQYLTDTFEDKDTVSMPHAWGMDGVSNDSGYPIEPSVSVSVSDTVSVSDVEDIVNHLNEKCGTSFKAKSKDTKTLIRARMKEGYTVADFFTVIDKMSEKWLGDTKMQDYLRPKTLFGTKFEGYLNAPRGKPEKAGNKWTNIDKRNYDFDEIERSLYV